MELLPEQHLRQHLHRERLARRDAAKVAEPGRARHRIAGGYAGARQAEPRLE
jgi:hypothetical protein